MILLESPVLQIKRNEVLHTDNFSAAPRIAGELVRDV